MPLRPVRLVAAATVPILVLLASACGQSAAPSQEEYVAAADGRCQAADDRMAELQQEYDVETWKAKATGESTLNVDRPERWLRARIIPEYKKMADALKSIPPPDGDAAYLTDLYADLDRLITIFHTRPSAGRDIIRKDDELRRRFASYGMEVCGTV